MGGFPQTLVPNPIEQIFVSNSSGNQANASPGVGITPGSVPGTTTAQTFFLTGFEITGTGATNAAVITVTITGVGGVQSTVPTYEILIPAGVTTSITPLVVSFPTPLKASGAGVGIVINVPAFGAGGNTNSCCTMHGYCA